MSTHFCQTRTCEVYDDTLLTTHIWKGRVTLINPLGKDLLFYEEIFDQYITECEQSLIMDYAYAK